MKYSNNYMYILMKIATVVIACRNQQYASGVSNFVTGSRKPIRNRLIDGTCNTILQ